MVIMNDNMNVEDYANKIIELAEIKFFNMPRSENAYRAFGVGENSIVFEGTEKYIEYYRCLETIFQYKKELADTYSYEAFENDFIGFIRPNITSRKKLIKKDIEDFLNTKLHEDLKEYFIIRGIIGVDLLVSRELTIGPFKIFPSRKKEELIEQFVKYNKDFISELYNGWEAFQCLITYSVKARHHKKAEEIANEKFYQFELFVKFALGKYTDSSNIGILTYPYWYYDKSIIIEDEYVHSPSALKGAFQKILIDDPYFHDVKFGHKILWELLGKNSTNKIENRIISSIEWIGRANTEPNLKNRFLQYIISYESIFTISEKSIITPGIANQISEGFALLLGNTYEERIDIESRIKELYGIRSAIAHGSNKIITKENAYDACKFAIGLIRKFLTDENLLKISNPDELNKYLKKIKYS